MRMFKRTAERREVKTVTVLEVQCQNADEHQRTACHRIKDELHSGINPAFPTPNTDEKVHRD